MRRDILFSKHEGLLNALLSTGLCEDTGNWIIKCDDDINTMKTLQQACSKYVSNSPYKNYKLSFAPESSYASNVLTF